MARTPAGAKGRADSLTVASCAAVYGCGGVEDGGAVSGHAPTSAARGGRRGLRLAALAALAALGARPVLGAPHASLVHSSSSCLHTHPWPWVVHAHYWSHPHPWPLGPRRARLCLGLRLSALAALAALGARPVLGAVCKPRSTRGWPAEGAGARSPCTCGSGHAAPGSPPRNLESRCAGSAPPTCHGGHHAPQQPMWPGTRYCRFADAPTIEGSATNPGGRTCTVWRRLEPPWWCAPRLVEPKPRSRAAPRSGHERLRSSCGSPHPAADVHGTANMRGSARRLCPLPRARVGRVVGPRLGLRAPPGAPAPGGPVLARAGHACRLRARGRGGGARPTRVRGGLCPACAAFVRWRRACVCCAGWARKRSLLAPRPPPLCASHPSLATA